MGQNSEKFKEVEKVPQTFSIFPPPHSSNILGVCWRLQIKETSLHSLGYLWSLKSEQRCQSTTASCSYFYQILMTEQFKLNSLWINPSRHLFHQGSKYFLHRRLIELMFFHLQDRQCNASSHLFEKTSK